MTNKSMDLDRTVRSNKMASGRNDDSSAIIKLLPNTHGDVMYSQFV
jgi:hypothetical protein